MFFFSRFDLAVELQSGGGRVAVVIFDASGWYYALTFDMYSSRDQLYNLISNMKVIQRNKYADNSVGMFLDWLLIPQ
ncbi:hypothetical protein DPMN_024342 [Dreissena polymorpha]|uniref:Uncharacterized protein n=1 Tax=Dreissena polymorpha TaxID=45954 RepID=A0A9D4CPQ6_DREPO|nr:hypothetical protein DPMN_054491 [Dreissena polymorpha]KAH3861414.1 hypothetical protein DPMN_024342 [Dreissena polymorpha]